MEGGIGGSNSATDLGKGRDGPLHMVWRKLRPFSPEERPVVVEQKLRAESLLPRTA
jgi:hypothetical protein